MHRDTPKQALAAREAHEALLELRQLLEEATKTTHAAELEAFHLGAGGAEYNEVRLTLESIVARLRSPDFDSKLSRARESWKSPFLFAPRGGSVEITGRERSTDGGSHVHS